VAAVSGPGGVTSKIDRVLGGGAKWTKNPSPNAKYELFARAFVKNVGNERDHFFARIQSTNGMTKRRDRTK